MALFCKTERKGHNVKGKDHHGTLGETFAASAFVFHKPTHPPIDPTKAGAKVLILLPFFSRQFSFLIFCP